MKRGSGVFEQRRNILCGHRTLKKEEDRHHIILNRTFVHTLILGFVQFFRMRAEKRQSPHANSRERFSEKSTPNEV
jgi:hypothetical protein